MARHAALRRSAPRTLVRAGLTLAAAGAALGAGGAATASAAPSAGLPAPVGSVDVPAAGAAVTQALPFAAAPLKNLKLDPLAGTGVDPLDNAVGTQVADFKPVSTAAVTGPVTEGGTLGTLPVVGTATGLLPG